VAIQATRNFTQNEAEKNKNTQDYVQHVEHEMHNYTGNNWIRYKRQLHLHQTQYGKQCSLKLEA
jgi:hypothetical protein